VGEVPVIFEERGYVPAMQITETESYCRGKGYFSIKRIIDPPARASTERKARTLYAREANVITQNAYGQVIESGVLVCRFLDRLAPPVTPRRHF